MPFRPGLFADTSPQPGTREHPNLLRTVQTQMQHNEIQQHLCLINTPPAPHVLPLVRFPFPDPGPRVRVRVGRGGRLKQYETEAAPLASLQHLTACGIETCFWKHTPLTYLQLAHRMVWSSTCMYSTRCMAQDILRRY